MQSLQIPASSVEYVVVPVTATPADGDELGAVTARMAWPLHDPQQPPPADEDWRAAQVVRDPRTAAVTGVRARYDGGLPRGRRLVWVEIEAGDEVVRHPAGLLQLT